MKNKKSKTKGLKITNIITIVLLLLTILKFYDQQKIISNLKAEQNLRLQKIEELNAKVEQLELEIDQAGTLKFIERVAREDYGMVKPREIIYIDKDKDKSSIDIKKNENGDN
ncbi:MAG: septum formation initiator family protein [Tissierellia bacterium]|nr:septum formation initiator family protein [Tissierellia bacterium]